MADKMPARRASISEAHARLGEELRQARLAAGKKMREFPGFTSGHISNVENGHAVPSKELVAVYANLAVDRNKVLSAYDTFKQNREEENQSRRAAAKEKAVAVAAAPGVNDHFAEISRAYRVIEAEDIYRLDSTGVVSSVTNILKIRALIPRTRFVVSSMGYDADRRRGVLSVEPNTGCSLAKVVESDFGVVDFALELDQAIDPIDDDPYTLSWTIHTHTDQPISPWLRSSTFSPLNRHALRVQFTPPAVPWKIWWFRDFDHLQSLVEPVSENVFTPRSDNFYFQEFYDLAREYWGMTWRWDVAT